MTYMGRLLTALLLQMVRLVCLERKGEKQIAKLEKPGRLGSRVLTGCPVILSFFIVLGEVGS